MRRSILAIVTLAVVCYGSVSLGEEFTLAEAVDAWSFMKGTWTVTSPDGTTDQVAVRIAPSKNAFVSESPAALHVFGWDPKTKLLEVQSFMANGTRAKSLFDRKSKNELIGEGGSSIDADGQERSFDQEATFTIVDGSTYHFSAGGQTWIAKRK
jgi:hypothetical protein